MPKALQFFVSEMFVATQWQSAAEKAAFANQLLRFIEAGFPDRLFTEALYTRLALTFGFIAHYDRAGFWSEYFEDRQGQARFLQQLLRYPCHGDPEWTFSDAEREIQQRLAYLGLHDHSLRLAAQEEEQLERHKLALLQARFSTAPPLMAPPSSLPVQLSPHSPAKFPSMPQAGASAGVYEQALLFG